MSGALVLLGHGLAAIALGLVLGLLLIAAAAHATPSENGGLALKQPGLGDSCFIGAAVT